ncbi:MAG: DUF202 domain-containing protein [Synechococcaceae cyanobacterium SM2_3_1]|nr:DUF202 domain-containing protein [Synechococcaceae cyanobacterium SM2_3_1]
MNNPPDPSSPASNQKKDDPDLSSAQISDTTEQTQNVLSSNELAEQRTEMAGERTAMAETRTGYALERTDLAESRTEMAKQRTRMASERTLLAWVRTSLSMISFGFGIDRLFKYLRGTEIAKNIDTIREIRQERILGLSLIILGVLAASGALYEHWKLLRYLEGSEKFDYISRKSLASIMVGLLILIGIFALITILILDKQLTLAA